MTPNRWRVNDLTARAGDRDTAATEDEQEAVREAVAGLAAEVK